MQTTTLPIQPNPLQQQNQLSQLSQLSQANAAQRNGGGDAGQFGALLSNEMAQRQAGVAPTAPQATPKTEAPRPPSADKPAQPDEAADTTASQPASAAGKTETDSDTDDATADADAGAKDGDATAADPAAAMLALMASLNPQPAGTQAAAAKPGAAAFDALTGARGKRGDAGQLAALQAALKNAAPKDGAPDAGLGKNFAAAGKPGGLLPAADDKAPRAAEGTAAGANAGADAADLHAALARLKGDAAPQGTGEAIPQALRDAAPAVPTAAQLASVQAQPAVMEAAQAGGAAAELSARVGTADWDNQVGQKVVWMVGSEEQTASLTLNPPDLGPMQVVLSVTGDQASVTFSSNQQEVRQALENALPRLREMMSESGIALGNATVNTGMPDGRQAQQDGSARGNGGGWGRAERDDGSVAATETTVRPARTRALGDNGMVDTFA